MSTRLKAGVAVVLVVTLLLGMRLFGQQKLPPEQQNAFNNCLEYIRQSSFDSKHAIDTKAVKARPLPEEPQDFVRIKANGPADSFARQPQRHWLFTIGKTDEHNFAQLVCESETEQAIGYIPVA